MNHNKQFINTTYMNGIPRPTPIHNKQAGGNPVAILSAIGAALKAIQPFGNAKKLLENHVSENGKKSTVYKVGHGIASVGSSLGIGHKKRKRKTKRKTAK